MSDSELDKTRRRGEIELCFPIKPVSGTSNPKIKKAFIDKIQQVTSAYNFILSGDVKIEIEWRIHERQRYEFPSSPDLDNILKPIVDALSGPQGLLIDDCQVQTVTCYWIDHFNLNEEEITVRIRLMTADDGLLKDKLFFVLMESKTESEMGTKTESKLCYPISFSGIDSQPALEAMVGLLESVQQRLTLRDELLELNIEYYSAQTIMPSQQFFHIQRINKHFESNLIKLADLKAKLLDNSQIIDC